MTNMSLALSYLEFKAFNNPTFRDKAKVRYEHHSEFEDFSDHIYCIMVLEVNNVYVAQDIEKSVKYFKNLGLATYPG